jgi:hypothetical protein
MSILMDAMVRTKALLARNPVAWILAALLIIGLYGRYTLGQSRTKLCDLIQEPLEWPAGPVASDSSIDGLGSLLDLSPAGSSVRVVCFGVHGRRRYPKSDCCVDVSARALRDRTSLPLRPVCGVGAMTLQPWRTMRG